MSEESSAEYLSRVRSEWEPESAQDRIAALEAENECLRATRAQTEHWLEATRVEKEKAERERDEARADVAKWNALVAELNPVADKALAIKDALQAKNATLRAQVAGLAGALKSTLPHLADIRASVEGWDTTEELNAAMAALARCTDTQPEGGRE